MDRFPAFSLGIFKGLLSSKWKRFHLSPACAACCLLVIICFPFLIKGRENCCKSGHCVTLAISQTGLWWVYVWSGLGSGKRLDWLSCIGAKCNTAQNHLSTPTHVNLVPPFTILSGIFYFTPDPLFISFPFCKQTQAGFVIKRMSYMTLVTFPHPPTLCWWKTLCHAMTSNNFPMKEWFLPTSCCSEGGTGVTVGTAWLGRGSSCIALLSIWILWTFPQADAIPGNHPAGRCLISPGDFPECTFSTVEKLPVTKLPSSASVEQITRQEWTAELIT